MSVILITQTHQLVTVGEITEEEIQVIKTMATVGNTIQDIENHLLKRDHIVLGKDSNTEFGLIVVANQLSEEHFKELFDRIMKKNNL